MFRCPVTRQPLGKMSACHLHSHSNQRRPGSTEAALYGVLIRDEYGLSVRLEQELIRSDWALEQSPNDNDATIATEAIMTTIPHRELRNHSSKILERVKNGETIDVTNNGEVAATLIPPSASPFERLLLSGAVRRSMGPVDFQALPRVKKDVGTTEILADLRGDY